jgi:hypothetical protein
MDGNHWKLNVVARCKRWGGVQKGGKVEERRKRFGCFLVVGHSSLELDDGATCTHSLIYLCAKLLREVLTDLLCLFVKLKHIRFFNSMSIFFFSHMRRRVFLARHCCDVRSFSKRPVFSWFALSTSQYRFEHDSKHSVSKIPHVIRRSFHKMVPE